MSKFQAYIHVFADTKFTRESSRSTCDAIDYQLSAISYLQVTRIFASVRETTPQEGSYFL